MPQNDTIYQSLDLPPHIVPATPSGAAAPDQPAKSPYASLIRAAVPQAKVLPVTTSYGAFFQGPNGYANADYWRVDVSDSRLSGAYDLISGRRPRSAGQVDLSPAAAKALGVSQGSTVTLAAQSAANGRSASFTVVGIMEQPDHTKAAAVFALAGAPAATGEAPNGWFLENRGGVSWSEVEALNRVGFPVISREVVDDPPARSQDPYYAQVQQYPVDRSPTAAAVAISAIVVGIALLEVVLLAGPAFAVSARRREREYAIIGAAGADSRQIRRIVLADGVVLGSVAGALGAGLGLGAACAALPFFARLTGKLPGAVHVSIVQVLGVVLLAVLLGLCSAMQPARSASRREIMATLSGRRAGTTRRRRVRSVVLGLLLIALGVFGETSGSHGTGAFRLLGIVGGVALIEVGAILCTPTIVSLVAKLGGILPLGPRLAVRDCARNLGRTTPAVAAMFAAVAGAVAAGGYLDSSITQQRQAYQPSLLANQIAMQVDNPAQAAQVDRVLRSVLPVTTSFVTESIAGYQQDVTAADQWSLSVLTPGATAASCAKDSVSTVPASAVADFQCGQYIEPTAQNGELVGGAAVLTDVTGVRDEAADRILDQGGIVLFDSGSDFAGAVRDGRASLVVVTDVPGEKAGTDVQTVRRYSLPATVEGSRGVPDPGAVIAPAAARQLGLVGQAQRTVLTVDLPGRVTAGQQIAASQVAARFAISTGATVDRDFSSADNTVNLVVLAFALLLALAAAAIATGLALADGRADHETLSAVGSSPWTRRWLAGSTALVITGLGILIGVPIGFLIVKGLLNVDSIGVSAANPVRFIVPWLNLGVMAAATPLLTALGAMLLSRSGHTTGRPTA
jgi:putative ABC transport system permease protein